MSKEILLKASKFKDSITSALPKSYTYLEKFGKAKSSFEEIKREQAFIDSTTSYSTTASTIHSFAIPGGVCSDFNLQCDMTNVASASPIYALLAGIQLIEIISSKGVVHKYTGVQLGQYLLTFNKENFDNNSLLKLMLDNGITTGSTLALATLSCPILAPGSNGILGRKSTPINLDMLQSQMVIRITLKPGASLSSGTACNMSKIRLSYYTWAMPEEQKKYYDTFYTVDLSNYETTSVSLTQNTDYSRNIQNSFDISGQKETIGLLVSCTTDANQGTAFALLTGEPLPSMKLTVQNYDLYNHRNNYEARMLMLNDYAVQPVDPAGSYIYLVGFKPDLFDLHRGELHGISMQNILPTLTFQTSTATGTFWLNTTAISKMTYHISNGILAAVY